MNLMDLLNNAGGNKSLESMAGSLGLDASKTGALVNALAPALMGSLQKQTQSGDGLSSLKNALQGGKHQEYLKNPDLMSSMEGLTDGNNILGHLFGSKEGSRNVAAQAAQTTGIDASLIKKALPMLASLAMGALSKDTNAGNKMDGSIGDMLGGLMGGSDGKVDIEDMLNIAKKFF